MIAAMTTKADPAHTIIRFFGGAPKVAAILGCEVTRVYRWEYPEGRNEGKGGIIPPKDARVLLAYASAEELDLKPGDFFDATRLRTVIAAPQQTGAAA
jgi:hypothetical protein